MAVLLQPFLVKSSHILCLRGQEYLIIWFYTNTMMIFSECLIKWTYTNTIPILQEYSITLIFTNTIPILQEYYAHRSVFIQIQYHHSRSTSSPGFIRRRPAIMFPSRVNKSLSPATRQRMQCLRFSTIIIRVMTTVKTIFPGFVSFPQFLAVKLSLSSFSISLVFLFCRIPVF